MSDEAIHDLARRTGIAVDWTDAAGEPQRVAPDVLRRMLGALELPCDTPAQLAASRDRLAATIGEDTLPPLITAEVGEPIVLASCGPARARLVLEDGGVQDIALSPRRDGRCALGAISQPGYHQLQFGEQTITLAVAPKKCFAVEDAAPDSRLWGLAVQLYGLRRGSGGAIGDTSGICALASGAAQHGADAIVLSPIHALFGADQSRYEPYSPSSRLFLNPLHADPSVLLGADHVAAAIDATGLAAEWARLAAADLIDWPAAAANKLALLRRLFDEFWAELEHDRGRTLARDFARFRQGGGDLLDDNFGLSIAHKGAASAAVVDWTKPFSDLLDLSWGGEEERLTTRLGLDSCVVEFDDGTAPLGPFGVRVRRISIPGRWTGQIDPAVAEPWRPRMLGATDVAFDFEAWGTCFHYDCRGLRKLSLDEKPE